MAEGRFVNTGHSLHGKTTQTELDWTGNPIPPGGAYGGRPEHQSDRDRMAGVRAQKKPMTPEKLASLRASMARARAVWAEKRRGIAARKTKRDSGAPGSQ